MKYAIIKTVNGTFAVASEHGDNLQSAKVAFHNECRNLWNAADVITAEVMIVDEQLDCVEGYKEFIAHTEA